MSTFRRSWLARSRRRRQDSTGELASGPAALAALAAAGLAAYDRDRHLRCLIPLWSDEFADTGAGGRLRVIARLRRALRAERVRGRAGHWTYDLNRHMALAIALKAETAAYGCLVRTKRSVKTTAQGNPPSGEAGDSARHGVV